MGVIIGLPVLGWGLFPVQWTNAAPNDLRQDLKQDWMRMSIDSYMRNHDKELAASRYQELGPDASNVLSTFAVGSESKSSRFTKIQPGSCWYFCATWNQRTAGYHSTRCYHNQTDY